MKISSVDIGTNTILLLVTEAVDGSVRILDGFLKKAGADTVTVSTGGIRHSVLMEQINPAGQDAVRQAYDNHKDSFFE